MRSGERLAAPGNRDRSAMSEKVKGAETVAVAHALRKGTGRRPRRAEGLGMLQAFPLLAIPAVIYNVFALGLIATNHADNAADSFSRALFNVPMPMNSTWSVSGSDLLVLLALIMLFFELIRATQSNKIAIINHSLSMILFIICLVEFLLVHGF